MFLGYGGLKLDYDHDLFLEMYNAPHFIEELSCSPGKIFLNLNPKDQIEAMAFLEEIKNKYSKKCDSETDIIDVLENFAQSLCRFVLEYDDFKESIDLQKYEYHEKLEFVDFCYSFYFLKIIDAASNFYITNCATNDSDNNSQGSPYEYLSSFYNNSKWDLKKLVSNHIMFEDIDDANEILASRLLEYVGKFNKHFQKILKGFKFYSLIDFLRENNLLLNFIVGLYAVDLNEVIFKDLESFKKCYHLFVHGHDDPFSKMSSISGEYLGRPILPSLLFSNIDLKNKNQISIYDPACMEGILLLDCKNYIKEINPNCEVNLYGCCTNSRYYALCLSKMLFDYQNLNNFSLVEEEHFQSSLKVVKDNTFDFMISNFENQDLCFKSFYTDPEIPDIFEKFNEKLLLVSSFKNLSIEPDVNNFLEEDFVESIIHLPISLDSGIDCILILNKHKDNKRKNKLLLIDEFDKNNIYESHEIPEKVIRNILNYYPKFKNYKNGKIFSISQIKNNLNFFNRIFFKFQGLMYDKNRESIKTDAPIYNFFNLIDIKRLKEDSFDLFIPYDIVSDKIAYYDAPEGIDMGYEITLKPIILKEYLYYYLNSNKGRDDLSYLTLGFRDMSAIYYLPIPVPSIDEQKNIVDAARKMEGFFNAMGIWSNNYSNNILNYKSTLKSYEDFSCTIEFSDNGSIEMCSHWKIVYQGLILPLAAAYLKATKGSNNDDTRKKNYLVLFEFIASFNVIILVSAIKNSAENTDDYDKILKELWALRVIGKDKFGNIIYDNKSWHRMSFGSWTALYGNLYRIFKNYNFTTVMDKEFFETLASNKYKKLFNKLRHKERNADAHGGFENDIDVTIKVQELQKYMDEDIFDILKLYSGLKLYYTTGKNEQVTPKQIEYEVISLNGPCNPPMPSKVKTTIKLNANSLYLYDSLNNDFLELDNDLIRFKQIPNSEQYGFYIYDSINAKENVALYKCYYDKEPWKIPLKTDDDTFLKVSDEFLNKVLRIKKL